MTAEKPTLVYVGTYTERLVFAERHFVVDGKGEGIYVFALDPVRGDLSPVSVAQGIVSPALLAISPDQRFLYSVNECDVIEGLGGGGVSAFAIDPANGALEFLNRQPSHGHFPCFITVDGTSRFAMVANHENGSLACYPIRPNGELGEASETIQHVGSSVHPQHQLGPHIHSVNLDPTNRFLLVCDKGIDKVVVYLLDPSSGRLLPNDPPSISVQPGSGPRHLAFHPSGRYAFVINELSSTLTAFAWDSDTGTLREAHTLSTLPIGYFGRNSTADVRVHPNGRFVYGTNRGHDSIAVFEFDESSGRLAALGYESTLGAVPRAINIDPTGRLLFAANQNSDTIVAFFVDPQSGSLTPTGAVTHVPTPVCIRFLQR